MACHGIAMVVRDRTMDGNGMTMDNDGIATDGDG